MRTLRRRTKYTGHTPVPIPAGWYPVPDSAWERYNDGIGWTSKVRRVQQHAA